MSATQMSAPQHFDPTLSDVVDVHHLCGAADKGEIKNGIISELVAKEPVAAKQTTYNYDYDPDDEGYARAREDWGENAARKEGRERLAKKEQRRRAAASVAEGLEKQEQGLEQDQ